MFYSHALAVNEVSCLTTYVGPSMEKKRLYKKTMKKEDDDTIIDFAYYGSFIDDIMGEAEEVEDIDALAQKLCRRFETGGSLSRRVSVLRAPAQMGRARGRARRGERRGGRSRA
jgi:hypothetical protein